MFLNDSVVSWQDSVGLHIRLYTCDGTTVTEQKCESNGWSTGGFSQPGTASAATAWVDSNGQVHIRVYVCNGSVQEWCYDGPGPWSAGKKFPG